MTLLTISSIKKQKVSDNGRQVTLTVEAKHVGELEVLLPPDCYDELISTFSRARTLRGGRAVPEPAATPAAPSPAAQPPVKPGHFAVKVPKTWLVTSETQSHGVVLLVFDHQTDSQAGFAMPADAAKRMADGLVKNADAVLAAKPQPSA